MKPEKIIFDEQDKIEVKAEIPDKFSNHVGKIKPFKGHTLFEINCTTGEIVPATMEEVNVDFATKAVKKKVITKPNCLYISCLNKKSATKKFMNWLIKNTIK